ncbi:MAG: DNA repair protein RecN, partial [Burkholderiales bacterium]|nr:DNA repair protein RecN [Burkholderiales bacterium]
FNSGLTVITGETGSGKSIVIDALMLLFGARISKEVIRENNAQAIIEAEFILNEAKAILWLEENGLIDSNNKNGLICRRLIDIEGKGRIFINDFAVTATQIKILGELILDIHTQHASVTLIKTDIQRMLLDEYAGITKEVEQLALLFKQIQQLDQELEYNLTQYKTIEFNRQALITSIAEIENLKFNLSNWLEINQEHKQISNAALILNEFDLAQTVIQGDESSILKQVRQINLKINKLPIDISKLEELSNLLNSVEIELQEFCHSIELLASKINSDPERLNNIEQRINEVYEISRKYKIKPEEIEETLKSWQNELNILTRESNIEQLEAQLKELNSNFMQVAQQVSKCRSLKASELSEQVTNILTQMSISGQFSINLEKVVSIMSFGLEKTEFLVSFNKGMSLQPLAKAASGGELSRTALALYLLLSQHNPPEVIIFDEIDVGLGGKVAALVGKMLQQLSRNKQVICITHQAQTAAFGTQHLVVNKYDDKVKTEARIKYLTHNDRVNEIARMLGGMKITPTTLNHARELLGIKE